MKLYYAKGACSLAVRIVINALNLPCKFELVNLSTHQTQSGEDFYHITDKGAVGALVLDDGTVMTENSIIMQYLADTYETSHVLLPAQGIPRYRVLEWLNFIAMELHKGTAPLNANIPETVKNEIFKPPFNKKLAYLEKIFDQQFYLTGDTPCLADYYLYVVLRWLPNLGIARNNFKRVEAFFQRINSHPAVQKSLQQEELT